MAEADGDDGLPLLGIAVDVQHQLAPKALRPLRPVDEQHAALGVGAAAVGYLAVRIGEGHLLRDDDGYALNRAQHAGEQRCVGSELVHSAELLHRLGADECVHIHNPRQLGRARAVFAELDAQFVEHIARHRRVVVVRLRRVIH